ncbi:hypothetical protein [Tahibacter caeni]|uniref:hypothetical protein n=1 Tax=Tahibacter caeni TaxID=1453545 RepID=UPI00214933E7|nr:hypothetical protein [Tahibacter caeni]
MTQAETRDAAGPRDAVGRANRRGSLGQGIGIGLLALTGSHLVLWGVLPSLHPFWAAMTFFVAPWIVLAAVAVQFLRRREPRTAWGLLIAAAIVVGTVALLFGLVVLIFSQGSGHH